MKSIAIIIRLLNITSQPPTINKMNSYAALAGFDEEDDDGTVIASNCTKGTQEQVALNAQAQFKIPDDRGIADAGCTGHLVTPPAPVINIKEATNPITISQPNGQ